MYGEKFKNSPWKLINEIENIIGGGGGGLKVDG
jgi:hypothetical protein